MNSSLRLSGSRSAAALVAGLALAAGLTACGSDGTDDTASDPAASSSASDEPTSNAPEETPDESTSETTPESGSGAQEPITAVGSAGVTEATLLSQTEGGGSTSTMAFALDTEQAVADFAAQFDGGFGDTVSAAATQTGQQAPDATAYGATVSVGCEAPRGVAIDAGEAGFEVIPRLPKSNIQCLAPMTFVVLFAVPNA